KLRPCGDKTRGSGHWDSRIPENYRFGENPVPVPYPIIEMSPKFHNWHARMHRLDSKTRYINILVRMIKRAIRQFQGFLENRCIAPKPLFDLLRRELGISFFRRQK